MKIFSSGMIVVLIITIIGCVGLRHSQQLTCAENDSSSLRSEVSLTTDEGFYTIGEKITFTVTNESSDTVNIIYPICLGKFRGNYLPIQINVDESTWANWHSILISMDENQYTPVGPGGQFSFQGEPEYSRLYEFSRLTENRARMCLWVSLSSDPRESYSDGVTIYSNVFTIKVDVE